MKILSIVIPNYNHSRFLPDLLGSIEASNKRDLIKLIIIDGKSDDGFYNKIEGYTFDTDVVISERDNGQANAINKGLSYVDTKYWMWQNSDDYFNPLGLAKIIDYLEETEAPVIQCLTMRERSGKFIPIPLVVKPKFCYKFRPYFLNNQSLIFKASVKNRLNEKLFYAFDLELFTKIIQLYRIDINFNVLGIYRSHDDTKTSKFIQVLRKEMFEIGHKYSTNFLARILGKLARLLDLLFLLQKPSIFVFNCRGLMNRQSW